MVSDPNLRRRTVIVGAVARTLLVISMVAMMVLLVLNTTAIRSTQLANRKTLVNTRQAQAAALASQRLIVDCTTPTGECFQRAAKRQAQIIGDPPAPINNVVILAAACADRPGIQTEATIRACVLAGLKETETP